MEVQNQNGLMAVTEHGLVSSFALIQGLLQRPSPFSCQSWKEPRMIPSNVGLHLQGDHQHNCETSGESNVIL